MATPLDVEFLKLAVQHAVFDRTTAEKLLEIIDIAGKRGQALSAAQAAINLGFLDAKRADAISAMARTSTGTSVTHGQEDAEGAFALEGFRLDKKLGRGACGASYEATRLADQASVVLKVLTRKFAKHPRTLAAVLDEARRAKGFEHENVVALRDVVSVSGRDVLVFDRVRGRSLTEELRAGPLPTLRATEVAIAVAKGLVAAHARGLAHGDVRPAKILADAQGGVRLADFGMAHASCLASGFGQAGVPYGHPEYLAPEVVQERSPRPTPLTDVYALGVTLYELCCARVPHRGFTHRETLRRHFEAPLPPPPEEVHLSSALADVILRLTAKDPKRRPADMKVALHGLEEYRRARLAGHTSDGVNEPAKPAPAEQAISADDWGKQSAVEGEHSAAWSAQAIESAERVGPAEFTGEPEDASDEPRVPLPVTKGSEGPVAKDRKTRKGCGLLVLLLLALAVLTVGIGPSIP